MSANAAARPIASISLGSFFSRNPLSSASRPENRQIAQRLLDCSPVGRRHRLLDAARAEFRAAGVFSAMKSPSDLREPLERLDVLHPRDRLRCRDVTRRDVGEQHRLPLPRHIGQRRPHPRHEVRRVHHRPVVLHVAEHQPGVLAGLGHACLQRQEATPVALLGQQRAIPVEPAALDDRMLRDDGHDALQNSRRSVFGERSRRPVLDHHRVTHHHVSSLRECTGWGGSPSSCCVPAWAMRSR